LGKFLPFEKTKKKKKKKIVKNKNSSKMTNHLLWELFVLPQRKASPRANVLSLEIMAFPQCNVPWEVPQEISLLWCKCTVTV
jgi:hypothetical protein